MQSLIKYLGIIAGLVAFSISTHAASIEFYKGSWEDALAIAKAEQKLIFVDAYAVWCGPCKMMDRNTFSQEEVAGYFNENFINLKLDVEKGEGITFADEYKVTGMPTLFFLNYKGEVVRKVMGYQGPRELLREAKKANKPINNKDKYALAYEAGSNKPDILYHHAMNLAKSKEDYREPASRYFATQDDKALLSQAQNWEAIQTLTSDINSREFQLVLDKQKKFRKAYGDMVVSDFIYSVLKTNTLQAALTQKVSQYQLAVTTAQDRLNDDGLAANRLKMIYAEATRDWGAYAQKARYHFSNYLVTNPEELSQAGQNFYLHVEDEDALNEAIKWVQQSIAIENKYYNNKVLAYLYLKLGDKVNARRAAFKTLKIAELKDHDPTEMENFLANLNE
ncbi:MAG: thioredoxin family protein [Bacteroidota bacterium]